MTGRKGDIKRITALAVIIASLLIGMTFTMSGNALAGKRDGFAASERPFLFPFLFDDLDELFFEEEEEEDELFFEREEFEFENFEFDDGRFPRGPFREPDD
jgi:hypothetical protein